MELLANYLDPFLFHEHSYKKEHKFKVSRSQEYLLERLLDKYVDQPIFRSSICQSFSYNIETKEMNYKEYESDAVSSIVNVTFLDNCFVLTSVSSEQLASEITNCTNDHYCLPITLKNCKETDNMHVLSLVFDKKQKKVFAADPNGFSTYFDSICGYSRSNIFIDKIYNKLTSSINIYMPDFNFEYVDQGEWLSRSHVINRHLDDKVIDSGNCYLNTFLIAFLLKRDMPLDTIYDFFSLENLSSKEYAFIMSSMTAYIYNNNEDIFSQLKIKTEEEIEQEKIYKQLMEENKKKQPIKPKDLLPNGLEPLAPPAPTPPEYNPFDNLPQEPEVSNPSIPEAPPVDDPFADLLPPLPYDFVQKKKEDNTDNELRRRNVKDHYTLNSIVL